MDLSPRSFSLSGTIEAIMESLGPISANKGLEMLQEGPSDLPRIESDEERVHQILQNLIGNAIKFTDEGSVTVSARCDEENFYVQVQDTGIGISEKDLSHIFEEFRQVDGTSARQYEGTGLGLAIANKAARILGGGISVKSTLEKGSTFSLTLPIQWKEALPKDEPLTRRVSQKILPGQKTILVVDDEPEVVTLIAGFVSSQGYNVITATSGKEALELARSHHPFAITLDIIMPDMDGWEVLERLKKDPDTADIPVIVASITDDRQTGFALGAVGYITKPVNRDVLVGEINKIGRPGFRSIMVVDDNEIDRQEISWIIQEEGLRAIVAEDGPECMALIQRSPPDVLVLDLMMPGMDGFEVLEKLREDPGTVNLPVIVVTAKDLTTQDRKRLSHNVASVLEKTETTSSRLLQEIKRILLKIEDLKTRPEAIQNRILLVEDNEAGIIQIKAALQKEGYSVDVAQNGQEALDYVQHTIPEGIVLDLMMPEVDGFEVLEKIRGQADTANIPVLILTAKDLTPEDLEKLSANNIQQLVQKGDVDPKELLFRIRTMLGRGTGKLET
jgi:CheY-like chemotaxis protein